MLHRKKIGKPYYRFCQKKRKDNNLEYRSRKWATTNIRILRSLPLIRCWLWYVATVSSTISQIDHPRGDAMEVATWLEWGESSEVEAMDPSRRGAVEGHFPELHMLHRKLVWAFHIVEWPGSAVLAQILDKDLSCANNYKKFRAV